MDSPADKTPEQVAKKKAAIVKAKASGFAQGKEVSPAKKAVTERIDEALEPRLDRITRKMLEAWESGLDSDNVNIRVSTAHRLMGHLYKPTQNVKVEGEGSGGGNTVNFNIISTDGMSAADREMLERVKKATGEAQEVIDVEVVEDE